MYMDTTKINFTLLSFFHYLTLHSSGDSIVVINVELFNLTFTDNFLIKHSRLYIILLFV